MFAENEYARTLLENLVKDYNTNKKNNDRRNYTNSKKIWWVPNIVPKLRKYFIKGKQRHYFHISQKLTKHPISEQTETTT